MTHIGQVRGKTTFCVRRSRRAVAKKNIDRPVWIYSVRSVVSTLKWYCAIADDRYTDLISSAWHRCTPYGEEQAESAFKKRCSGQGFPISHACMYRKTSSELNDVWNRLGWLNDGSQPGMPKLVRPRRELLVWH
jgi:hypothetical protein